ncbi:MAG: DNA-protecting protein DprA [Cytophagales bacterium]|nr:MAG: DNA-protecting protein DprA [Cytophagales bacterium]
MQQYLYDIALYQIEGIGAVLARQLIAYCGSSEAALKMSAASLQKIPQIGEVLAQKITSQSAALIKKAHKDLEAIAKNNIQIVALHEENYPKRLREIHDAPLLLYYQGNTPLNAQRVIAIVGTRQASDYGKSITEQLVKDLKKYNPLIVSGLAYGIDIAAHRAALKYELPTLGVLANGLDQIYPKDHLKTAQEMQQQGGLITENALGIKADATRFPARNRIIAGLSDATIVVEAREKGGALITANLANEYDREVFAVPNDVNKINAVGCHHLIKTNKAHLLTEAEDIAYLLNWDNQQPNKSIHSPQLTLNLWQQLQENEQKIAQFIQKQKEAIASIDDLIAHLQLSASQVNVHLFNLEMQGIVRTLPGNKIQLLMQIKN